ncbi:Retrovirus-related Pol polyprotein from transposon RE1 [Sesamum angolense]|uniref:Retrovirus-related Pol polyprotein from transposon RE1 n=1 Tax=Sesamum angolense TaxID=2727404 RepID=A0AAE1X899_9LAMI|nr:Retrovirus-related Pol polyprotein from transposon RE1 [Sesamum angolense]
MLKKKLKLYEAVRRTSSSSQAITMNVILKLIFSRIMYIFEAFMDVAFHDIIFSFQTNPPEPDPILLSIPKPIPNEDVPAHFPPPISIPETHPSIPGVKSYLDKLFNIKDLGHAKYFLGLELAHSQHGLHVSQSKFLRDILTDSAMLDCKLIFTPLSSGLHLSLDSRSLLPHPDRYRHLVGRLSITWFSFLPHVLDNFLLILMRAGPLVMILVAPSHVTASFLEHLLFPGRLKNKLRSPAPLPRRNIAAWDPLYVKGMTPVAVVGGEG